MKKDGHGSPAVEQALRFIKERIDKNLWHQGERLPSTRNLAHGARVSHKTMAKAIVLLKSGGIISGVERGRLWVGRIGNDRVPFTDDNSIHQMRRTELEKDINQGIYSSANRLPPLKELQIRYGVCFRTMRAILCDMLDDGALLLERKAFKLPVNATHKLPTASIVFISYQIQKAPRSALNLGSYQVLNLFERECMQKGLKLEIVIIDFYHPGEARRIIAGSAINKSALGFVIDLWWYPGEDARRAHIDLFARLATFEKPVAILDEIGTFILPLPFESSKFFQVFRCEGKKAASRVARELLRMGHRSAAYISHMHAFSYSQQRYEGAAEQFAHSGSAGRVYPVVKDTLDIDILHVLSMSQFNERLTRKVIATYRTRSQAEDQFRRLVEFRKRELPQPVDADGVRNIRKILSVIIDFDKRDLEKAVFDRLCLATLSESSKALQTMVLYPMFDQALTYKDATAWICANDGIALTGLQFCRSRNIAIPGNLSIVGFDNEPVDAAEERLTTFDFNAQGFINAILHFIASPPRGRGRHHHVPIEIEGVFIVRESTRSCNTQ